MPRKKTAKRPSIWDPDHRPYGTNDGDYGSPRQWKEAYEDRMNATESASVLRGSKSSAHAILGLDEGCTDPVEIKKAFRRKVFLVHPDHGGTDAAFKEVKAAYSSLMDKYGS